MPTSLQQPPKRVLIVRPSALGDVCRTVCAAVSIRRCWPDAQIDWVVRDSYVDAVIAHPDVDNVIAFSRSKYGDVWRSAATLRDFRDWVGGLRAAEYDIAFDLQGLGRSALITYLSRAKRRIGFASAREFAWIGYTTRHPASSKSHTVDQMLDLLAHEGIEPVHDLRLYTPDDAREWWAASRADLGVGDRYAVLAPTSRHDTKRWPEESWIELIPHLRDRGVSQCLVIGAPDERSQIPSFLDELQQDPDLVDLVGALTVGQLMAVIEHASLVIANDSAPLHMAVGYDRPLVALFGPTEPSFVGPYGRSDAVVRAYDPQTEGTVNYRDDTLGDSLMRRITVAMAAEAVNRALAAPIANAPTAAR